MSYPAYGRAPSCASALGSAMGWAYRCRMEPFRDQGGACGAASGAPRARLCLGRPAQRARAVPRSQP